MGCEERPRLEDGGSSDSLPVSGHGACPQTGNRWRHSFRAECSAPLPLRCCLQSAACTRSPWRAGVGGRPLTRPAAALGSHPAAGGREALAPLPPDRAPGSRVRRGGRGQHREPGARVHLEGTGLPRARRSWSKLLEVAVCAVCVVPMGTWPRLRWLSFPSASTRNF